MTRYKVYFQQIVESICYIEASDEDEAKRLVEDEGEIYEERETEAHSLEVLRVEEDVEEED